MYRFPKTKFVDENKVVEQLRHTLSEVNEAVDAYRSEFIDGHVVIEILDIIHSAETALRIMQADFGVTDEEIKVAENIVFEKNRDRGYYVEDER